MNDAAISRALGAAAAAAGCPARLLGTDMVEWASATFSGLRHRTRLHMAATPARTAWLAALSEAEWSIPGWLVADLAVTAEGDDVVIEMLVIHDC